MRARTLLVVVVAVLAITAMPVSAQNASAVASEHTTFGTGSQGEPSPTTLNNLGIDGSGESASVQGGGHTEYNPVDSQGDGATDVSHTLVGDRYEDSIVKSSLRAIPTASGSVTDLTVTIGTTYGSDYGAAVDIYAIQEQPDTDHAEGTLIKENWDPEWSTGQQTIQLDTTYSVDAGKNYTFAFVTDSTDGDGSGDQLLIASDDSVSDVWQVGTAYGTADSAPDIDLGIDRTLDSATYIGAPHSAERASAGWVNVSLQNAQADVRWQEDADSDGSWSNVTSQTVTSTTNVTADLSGTQSDRWRVRVDIEATGTNPTAEIHDEGLLFNASAPVLSSPDPPDGATISDYDGDISIQVNDTDFGLAQGDSVTVTATNESGGTIGSQTISSNQTVTISYSPMAGENEISWDGTDNYTRSDSFTHTFTTPATLYIRNESQPTQLVDSATLDVTFYASHTSVQTSTSNGTVSLEGLPADEQIVGVVSADGYRNRHIVLQSIFSQESVYLLDENITAVEDRFTLADQSGQFEADETTAVIKRPLTRDYDDDGTNETQYETIAADKFGVAGYSLFLEEGVRYRIAVRDSENYQRLGPYTADVSETVELQPGEFQIAINDSAEGYYGLGYYEAYEANGGDHQRLTFEYYDAANETDQLEITVYEQGNASNQLEPTTTLDGPFGTTSVNYNLTDQEANKTWVIDWTAERGAETVGGEEVVGRNIETQAANFPAWVQEATAAAIIILTLALFSRVNRETGAVTASMVGGGFWFAGWLPPEAGGAVVVALAVSVIFKTGIPEV